jgi:hypothetical protein
MMTPQQKYHKTGKGQRARAKSHWKGRGVKGDLDLLYDHYTSCDKCEKCNKLFNDTSDRCLDHDHITGQFRYVLCRNCNFHFEKGYMRGIAPCRDYWRYSKTIKGKKYQKYFKNKVDVICYKYIFILKVRAGLILDKLI